MFGYTKVIPVLMINKYLKGTSSHPVSKSHDCRRIKFIIWNLLWWTFEGFPLPYQVENWGGISFYMMSLILFHLPRYWMVITRNKKYNTLPKRKAIGKDWKNGLCICSFKWYRWYDLLLVEFILFEDGIQTNYVKIIRSMKFIWLNLTCMLKWHFFTGTSCQ